jgi:hypothetical protein
MVEARVDRPRAMPSRAIHATRAPYPSATRPIREACSLAELPGGGAIDCALISARSAAWNP